MELIFDMLTRLKRHHKMLKVIVITPRHLFSSVKLVKVIFFLCTNDSETDFVNVWVNFTDELVRC